MVNWDNVALGIAVIFALFGGMGSLASTGDMIQAAGTAFGAFIFVFVCEKIALYVLRGLLGKNKCETQ